MLNITELKAIDHYSRKSIVYLFYILVFLVPLLLSARTSEMFEMNKMLLIYFLSTAIGTVWIARRVLGLSRRMNIVYIIPLLIFLLFQIISAMFSIDLETSLFGYYSRLNGGVVSIVAYTVLFWSFAETFQKKEVDRFLLVSLGSSTVVLLWGILSKFNIDFSCLMFVGKLSGCWSQDFNPEVRIFSTIGQPNWLGGYLAMHLFVGLYFVSKSDITQRLFGNVQQKTSQITMRTQCTLSAHLVYLVLNLIGIWFTASRSAILAVFFASFVGVVIFLKKRTGLSILLAIPLLTIIIALGALLFSLRGTITVNNLATGVTDSFTIRKIVWKGAIETANKHPILGSGPETFAYAYYLYKPVEHNLTSEWDFLYNKAHNEFFHYLATTGYVGLALYMFFIVSVVYLSFKLYRKYPVHSVFFLLSFITIQVTNFFGFSTSTTQLYFYLIPAMLIVYLQKAQKRTEGNVSAFRIVFSLLPIAVGAYIVFFWLNYYKADLLYAKSIQSANAGQYSVAAEQMEKGIRHRASHVYYDKLSSYLANVVVQRSLTDSTQIESYIKSSDQYISLAQEQSPYNILYIKTAARNNMLFYQATLEERYSSDALVHISRAAQIAPNDAKTLYEASTYYRLVDDVTKEETLQKISRHYLEKALELRPILKNQDK